MLVGWDWASTAHDGTVIDDAGAVVDRWTPPHTEAELSDALVRLGRSGRPEELPVAIEQSSGLFVDRLWPPATRSFPSMPAPSTSPQRYRDWLAATLARTLLPDPQPPNRPPPRPRRPAQRKRSPGSDST